MILFLEDRYYLANCFITAGLFRVLTLLSSEPFQLTTLQLRVRIASKRVMLSEDARCSRTATCNLGSRAMQALVRARF